MKKNAAFLKLKELNQEAKAIEQKILGLCKHRSWWLEVIEQFGSDFFDAMETNISQGQAAYSRYIYIQC